MFVIEVSKYDLIFFLYFCSIFLQWITLRWLSIWWLWDCISSRIFSRYIFQSLGLDWSQMKGLVILHSIGLFMNFWILLKCLVNKLGFLKYSPIFMSSFQNSLYNKNEGTTVFQNFYPFQEQDEEEMFILMPMRYVKSHTKIIK